MTTLARLLAFLAAAIPVLWQADVSAQPYPSKPVRMVVPFAPAGPPDILARLISQKLGEGLAQPVVVENRVGAGGIIGSEFVAKAAPDGYTLLFGSVAALLLSPPLYGSRAGYDWTSFTPVSIVGTTTFVLVVNSKVPANTLKELIDLAKAQPGKLNYGASSQGTPPHIVAEMFKTQAGVDIFAINYKGSADSITALLAGDVQMVIDQFAAVLPLISSGKVRPLVVTSNSRVRQLPDVPSAAESGLPGLNVDSWFGILGPKGMSGDVSRRLHGELVKAIGSKDLMAALERQGLVPATSTPEEFGAMLKRDAPRWAAAVKASGAKVE